VIALEGQRGAMTLERGLELGRRARALGGDLLGVAEGHPGALALADDRGLTLGRGPHLLVEPQALLAELADLYAHLLAALEQSLELTLYLRDGLTEIRQPVLALLERFPRLGLARRQAGQARAQPFLAVAQPRHLTRQPLALAGEPGEVGGDERQSEIALLTLQGLVLLRLLGLALERIELPAHLVHDVAHTRQVLAGGVELALGLVALLLVARDAGGFLDEHAPLVRLGRQDVIQLVLVHHRVGARVGAGAREEVEDVAQA